MRARVVTLQEVQEWLVFRLSELTRVEPQEIDVRKPFATYGLTSRETVGLSGDLCDWLGRDMSPTIVYNFPNIASLAWHLTNDVDGWASPDESNRYHQNDFDPIAIIGIGCRFPGAEGPDAFWKLLREGVDAITEVPPERWDAQAFYDPNPATPGKMNTRWGGFLSGVEQFDADFFSISTREAVQIDPQQRLLLEVSWEALEHACLAPAQLRGTKTGVFVGISTHDYYQLQMDDMLAIDAYVGSGSALSIAANRLSYFYDFRGPSLAIDTACSSSLAAVHLACQSLKNGESDLALAGGVNLILSPGLNISLSQARMMASDGRCKAFDDHADGYVRGEGCGIVVMKRLSQATRDGDTVLAIVRGTAINQDGRSNGLTAPNGTAQEAVIRQALSNSGVSPADISYVEAHGTGTSLGDPIEFNALKAILMKDRRPNQLCLLGSVKTNIGHLEAAAGIAGLIKIVLSFWYNEIPPILHFKRLNRHISLEGTTFLIPTEAHPWPVEQTPHRAGVSSFGFGGVNAHAVLERAIAPVLTAGEPLRPHILPTLSTQTEEGRLPPIPQVEPPGSILCLSANSPQALQQLAGRYAQYLDEHPNLPLTDLCYTANTGRAQFPHRLTALAPSNTELGQQLRAYSEGRETAGIFSGRVRRRQQPRIAFLCAGGGSQYVGMGGGLYETHPLFRQALDQCDQLLRGELERPLLKAIYPDAGDELLLNQVAYTQPALFALEYALAQVWRAYGVEPGAVMGHGAGEYIAAWLAGVFSLEDGLKLAAARGRLTHGSPEGGAMAAVSAGLKHLAPEPSEYQVEEFERLTRNLKFETPRLRMISNATGGAVESGEELGGNYWSRQLREPAQFVSRMESLKREGYDIFVELGPSATLVGLGRSCLGEEGGVWAPSLTKERKDWEQLQESLGRVWGAGVAVNWRKVAGGGRRKLVGLPSYPFQRQRYWLKSGESNKRRMGRLESHDSGNPDRASKTK